MISAAQIRAGRALINAKQSELAKAAGVALATLNNIERGVGDPRSSTLESIERALAFAGVECDGDGQRETVSLQRLSRPSAHDTYFACQRVLECLEPGSLLKVERVRFYVHTNSAHQQSGATRRIAVLVDGEARTLLFDQANFVLSDSVRVAEIARMLTAAFVNCPGAIEYVDGVVEDTTVAHLEEAVYRLSGLNWISLTHPKDLLTIFGDWTDDLERLADTQEHPLHEAFAAASGGAAPVSTEEPAQTPEPMPQEELVEPEPEAEPEIEVIDDSEPQPVELETEEPPSVVDAPPITRHTLSAEDVAKLLGEPPEAGADETLDEGPPLPDLSPPASETSNTGDVDYGDPPPLPDPSAPVERETSMVEEEDEPPPLPDPSAPDSKDDGDLIEIDEDDDPLLTTPPPSFKI